MSASGGNASHPACENSPTSKEMLINSTPAAVSQKLTELSVGKATSRAPIISGTAKFISPTMKAMATKKIMIVPWVEKI